MWVRFERGAQVYSCLVVGDMQLCTMKATFRAAPNSAELCGEHVNTHYVIL